MRDWAANPVLVKDASQADRDLLAAMLQPHLRTHTPLAPTWGMQTQDSALTGVLVGGTKTQNLDVFRGK